MSNLTPRRPPPPTLGGGSAGRALRPTVHSALNPDLGCPFLLKAPRGRGWSWASGTDSSPVCHFFVGGFGREGYRYGMGHTAILPISSRPLLDFQRNCFSFVAGGVRRCDRGQSRNLMRRGKGRKPAPRQPHDLSQHILIFVGATVPNAVAMPTLLTTCPEGGGTC